MKKEHTINMLHKSNSNKIEVVSKEEQHIDLCSNNVGMCCSSLDITTNEKSTDELLDELAGIFVESILWELEHGEQPEKGSNLLQGINERAS